MTNKYVYNRELPSRSNLVFIFPNSNGGTPTRVVLPFLENITLQETKAARYQDFKLFGRSSDLYGYMGADSRKFSLEFSLTFPHIQYEHPEYNVDNIIKEKQPKTTEVPTKETIQQTQAGTATKKYLDKRSQQYNSLFTEHIADKLPPVQVLGAPTDVSIPTIQIPNIIGSKSEIDYFPKNKVRTSELMLYWTNIVRASVVNDSKSPVLGPPIIRLTHGILYQDIPCICKNYSFSIEKESTYDLFTLMPQVINFSMELEELRTGDYGEYEKSKVVVRDNLVGYEALFEKDRSMDPGSLETQ